MLSCILWFEGFVLLIHWTFQAPAIYQGTVGVAGAFARLAHKLAKNTKTNTRGDSARFRPCFGR
jgi:hypothetical protein